MNAPDELTRKRSALILNATALPRESAVRRVHTRAGVNATDMRVIPRPSVNAPTWPRWALAVGALLLGLALVAVLIVHVMRVALSAVPNVPGVLIMAGLLGLVIAIRWMRRSRGVSVCVHVRR